MNNKFWRLVISNGGFTLTEVMIGISILTIAIVSATSVLVGLVNTNRLNLSALQAYYFAQEGLEAVRNIRDTNWLHNLSWMGESSEELWGAKFDVGEEYVIDFEYGGFDVDLGGAAGVGALKSVRPWAVRKVSGTENGGATVPTGFSRIISFKRYCDNGPNPLCVDGDQANYVLVESKVSFEVAGYKKEVVLSEVLTDWKGGAL